jgi:hypothetical protein
MYLLATLTPRFGRAAQLCETIAWLKKGMEGRGMTLLGAYQTVSGAPGRIIDIWEIESASTVTDALEGAAAHPRHQEALDRLAEPLAREHLRIVEGMGYSPPFRAATSPDAPHLWAKMTVNYGQVARLDPIIAEIKGVVEERLGWRLIGGYRTVIGDLGEVFDLWELPPGRTVDDMLMEARAIPEFARAARELPQYLTSEELLTLRAAPHHPW